MNKKVFLSFPTGILQMKTTQRAFMLANKISGQIYSLQSLEAVCGDISQTTKAMCFM